MKNNQEIDASKERVYSKIKWRLIPFLFICYIINIIDRFNIGYAKLQFMTDLHLNEAVFGVAAGMLSVGYVLFEVPSNLMLVKIGARKTMMRIMVLWGIFTVLLFLSQNQYHLYIFRFLVGAAEAGYFPGIIFFLTYWFPYRMRGRMTSLFVAALPLGGVVAGPLSGWIMEGMQGAYGLRGWQWLFIAEGLPTIALGIVAFFYLTDNVESASWLSKEEKNIVKSDLESDRAIHHTKAEHKFTQALRNPQVWLLSLVYFCYFCILNTILIWTPTLLKGMGVKTITSVGWLVCLISLIGTIGMILVGRSSDRMMERRWHVALCGIMASICFLLLPIASESIALTVGLLCVAAIGIYGLQGIFWTIPQIYLQGTAAAGGIALISSLGAMSGFFSPTLVGWIKQQTGSLYIGFGVVAVVAIIGMVVLLVTFPPPAARQTR